MHIFKKTWGLLNKILSSIHQDHISAFSAYSSFFLMLSFLPIVILVYTIFNIVGIDLLNFIGYGNAKSAHLLYLLEDASTSSTAVISISTIFTAWSAGRAFHAITEGFAIILKSETRKNYFLLRIRSLAFSLLFSVVFAMIITVGVFGNQIYHAVIKYSSIQINSFLFELIRFIFSQISLFFVLTITYRFVPNWENDLKSSDKRKNIILPLIISSGLCSIVIYLYTMLFSRYLNLFSIGPNLYTNLDVLVTVMLWIYGTLYVVLLGFKLCVFLKYKN